MIEFMNEKPLAEVKAEEEQREMEKSINQMMMETIAQMGEEITLLTERVKKLENK